MEFSGVLVFGLEISKVSNNFVAFPAGQGGWSFVLSGISRGKVKLKIPPVFKKVGLQPPLFVFSGRAQ